MSAPVNTAAAVATAPPAVASKPKVRRFKIVSVNSTGSAITTSPAAVVEATPKEVVSPPSVPVTAAVPKEVTPPSKAAAAAVTVPSATASSSPTADQSYPSPTAPSTVPRQQRYTTNSAASPPTEQQHQLSYPPSFSNSSPQQFMAAAPWATAVPPMPYMATPQPWWQTTNNQHANQSTSHHQQRSPKQQRSSSHRPSSPNARGGGGYQQPAKPLQSNVIGTSVYIPQRNGKRIERSLERASRDSLMQIIVELCSMNKSAAEYVESKAQLLNLYAPTTTAAAAVVNSTPMRGAAPPCDDDSTFATPGSTMPLLGASPLGATGASIAATYGELSPRLDECQTPLYRRPYSNNNNNNSTEDAASSPASYPSTASPARNAGDSDTASPIASRSSANTSVATSSSPERSSNKELASRRAFNTEKVHPCLYIYGACRHPVSCPCALLPFNLCLSWLRGVCHSGESCTMVHRLPDNCSEQVRLIHTLQEDDSNKGNLRTSPSMASRLFDTAKKLIARREEEEDTLSAAAEGQAGVNVSASTVSPGEAPSPVSTANPPSPHTLEKTHSSLTTTDDAAAATCPKQVEANSATHTTVAPKMPAAVAPEAATVARTLDLNDN